MILITTPTGDIGTRVLNHVLEAGERPRIVVRDARKLPDTLADHVHIIKGSHGDASVIEQALKGVTRVFWLPPGTPTDASAHAAYVGFSDAFANALPGSDVSHVVGISALGRGWDRSAGLVSSSLAMDDMIAETGVAYRALACASLMDNFMRQVEAIRDGAVFAPTPGDLKMRHVAKSDVAAVASRLLLSPDWRGVEEVPLYGPEDLSFNQMAATMSDVLQRDVTFNEMSIDSFETMLRSMGTSDGMARDYADMMVAKNAGMDSMDSNPPRHDTQTTFKTWVEAVLKPAVVG